MIHCTKCHTVNPPEQRYCLQCHKDLLPGESLGVRIAYLVAAGLLTALGVYILIRMSQGLSMPDWGCAFTSPVFWVILVIVSPVSGLVSALRRTPPHQRYLQRAKRHISLDPQQALADLTRALELAPDKAQAEVLKERAKVYQALGQDQQATRDQLTASQAQDAFEGSAAIASLAGLDTDAFVAGLRSNAQESLLKTGGVHALGYCPKCKDVAELDEKLHCKHHRRAKIKEMRFATPDDHDLTRLAILGSIQGKNRSMSKRRLVSLAAILISLPILYFYLYIPYFAPPGGNTSGENLFIASPTTGALQVDPGNEAALVSRQVVSTPVQVTLAIPTSTVTPTPTPVIIKAIVLNESINVRSGPGKDYDPVGVLYKGDEISIRGQNDAGDWLCLAEKGVSQEWVFAALVSVKGDVGSLPVVTDEP